MEPEGRRSLGRTAANLFNPGESRVTPGDPARIGDLGQVAPPPAATASTARSEWWWPLALAGLVLLLVEWILFHRPTRRAVARILRRGRPPAAGAIEQLGHGGQLAMIPVAFTDPIWLWLLLPAAALVIGGWWAASRTLPAARRVASLIIRMVLIGCVVASLAGARLALPSDRLSVVFLVDASASMLDASPRSC